MGEKDVLQAALLKRAIGYDYEEKKIIADKNGKPQKIEVYHKHVPPDIAAIREIISEKKKGRWNK